MQAVKIREQIPALADMIYLDNAGAGLPPLSVTEGMKGLLNDWSKTGEHWDEWLLDVVETRRLFSRIVSGKRNEVAVVPSVSAGLAAIASSVDFSKKREVVASSLNFPTNVILWQRMRESGLVKKVRVLEHKGGMVPLHSYEKAITDDTAVVAVDYVSWLSGAREHIREVSEVAHDHGALFVVDSFHALGVFPFDVEREGIDVLASGFYKWLCGPHGVACVYTSENLLKELTPSYLGWHGIHDNIIERLQAGRDPFDVPFPLNRSTPSSTAARFEWGTWSMVAVKGALEAMKFAMKQDASSRFRSIDELKKQLFEGLEELGVKPLTPDLGLNPGGGIVTFERKNHSELVGKLAKRRIFVSGRFGYVRVSPHFYNTSEEIDAFLRALRDLL